MKSSIHFILAGIFTISLLSTTGISYAENHIPSPREQMKSGISPENVICKDGFKLIIRANTNAAACVMDGSFNRILQIGWAKTVEDYTSKPQLSNFGEIKTIRTVPLYFDTGIFESKPEIVTTYNYVFEACAKTGTIHNPEILIISDSETKFVNLPYSIPAMSCKLGTTEVKAAEINSIKASLANKSDLAIITKELENKMNTIQEKLAIERSELAVLANQDSHSDDEIKKIAEKTQNIATLKESLEVARADWQKNQYVLITSAKEPDKIKPQLSNKELPPKEIQIKNYPHVNKIKVVSQYVDAGRLKSDPVTSSYKFFFEACASDNNISSPEILVRSDSEAKSIKLGESLNANSCQTNSTVVRAADKNSIEGTMVAAGDISKLFAELDTNVIMIQENIVKNKKELIEMANQNPPPENYEQKFSQVSNKIINLKNELAQAKEEFNIIKYMVYE